MTTDVVFQKPSESLDGLHCESPSTYPIPLFQIPQVACMQFINIVVHSVEDMNFRVHLQYDFTKLCLDDYLDVS